MIFRACKDKFLINYPKIWYCTTYTNAPAKYPSTASQDTCRRYHKKSIRSMPMAATPAAEPIMSALPPVPAQ